MVNNSQIKLVIWDLDDTFWSGTLSEGDVFVDDKNIQLIKDLTDRGIVNTICSKNDYEPTVKKLKEFGVDEYFVFKSIDWTPKGQRISQLIKDMGLRPANCLFLDDNIVNLNEAQFYSKDLMVAEPSFIPQLIEFCSTTDVTDLKHKRLTQYKVLEEKQKAREKVGDNLQFLFSSNTRVEIHYDCKSITDRLFELINRTNQLNFTKYRCTREELEALLDDETANCGYVTVKDNFGDYGVVGFFAIKNDKCIHFLFSCRTIGQGVEQWVYSTLGWPSLEVVGEVVNKVEKVEAPAWINQRQNETLKFSPSHAADSKVLFKGPCDMEIMTSYLNVKSSVIELTYVGEKHNSIEHHNHSANYTTFPALTQEEKEHLLSMPFNDKKMFATKMFDKGISVVFLSTLIEPALGVYQNKSTGKKFAFGEWCHPITDRNNWEAYISGTINNYQNNLTISDLQRFSDEYQWVGQITPQESLNNIKTIFKQLDANTHLCLILGSEITPPTSLLKRNSCIGNCFSNGLMT